MGCNYDFWMKKAVRSTMSQLLPKGQKLHMTPRPEDLPVRAHLKVSKQGSRTDLEIVVRSDQES